MFERKLFAFRVRETISFWRRKIRRICASLAEGGVVVVVVDVVVVVVVGLVLGPTYPHILKVSPKSLTFFIFCYFF